MSHQGKSGEAPLNPPSGGTTGEKSTDPVFHSPRLGGYQVQVMTEGYEMNNHYSFYLVKNIEIGADGDLRFFSLIHNKRITGKTEVDEKDYPPMEENENLIEYIQRVEKLPWMEWNLTLLADYLSCNIRGRMMYYTDDNGRYTFVSGEKISTREPDSESSTVVPMKRPT